MLALASHEPFTSRLKIISTQYERVYQNIKSERTKIELRGKIGLYERLAIFTYITSSRHGFLAFNFEKKNTNEFFKRFVTKLEGVRSKI